MFTKEFYELLMQIIKSWQVIAAAVVIFLYLKIVSYASKSYHAPRAKKIKIKKEKKAAPAAEASGKDGAAAAPDTNAELGLEEA